VFHFLSPSVQIEYLEADTYSKDGLNHAHSSSAAARVRTRKHSQHTANVADNGIRNHT